MVETIMSDEQDPIRCATVLIVDDDPEVLHVVSRDVKPLGCRIRKALSAEAALREKAHSMSERNSDPVCALSTLKTGAYSRP